MLQLSDLGLSPFQFREIEELDESLVASWLDAASEPSIRSPTGFFLTGVRSGKPPSAYGGENERARAVHLAEVWIVNAGLFCDTKEAVLDELFDGSSSRLRPWKDDKELRQRMVSHWLEHRERGVLVEHEFEARSERARAARGKR